jgi:hypothetical protein
MHVSQHYTDLLARAVANSQLEHSLALMATHIGRRASQGTVLRDCVLHVVMDHGFQKPVLVVSVANPGSGSFLTPGSGLGNPDPG